MQPALRAVRALPVFVCRVLSSVLASAMPIALVLGLVVLWGKAPHAEPDPHADAPAHGQAQAEPAPHADAPAHGQAQAEPAPHADAPAHGHPAHAVPPARADRQPADPAHAEHRREPAPLDSETTREDRCRAVQDALELARDHAPHVTAPPTLKEWLAGAHYPVDPAGLRLSKLSAAEKAMLVQGIMGTMEIGRPLHSGSQKPFQTALKRHAADPLRDDMVVGSRRWSELKRYLAGKQGPELLYLVNSLWNQFRFAEDAQTWGEDEYWAEPAEFARRRQGDCDDYVVAKYLTLRDLGFPVDRMRLVVGKLTRKKTDPREFHVVLRCQTEKGAFILENNRKVLLDDRTTLKRFRPVYSFNEKTEWLNFAWE